jgi:gamma-glutamylcyclotransferase (GGCT)/AIG2-like uncharacterized protein YtfP
MQKENLSDNTPPDNLFAILSLYNKWVSNNRANETATELLKEFSNYISLNNRFFGTIKNNLVALDIIHESLGKPQNKLFVYGSLMPGESNHFKLARFGSNWKRGYTLGNKVKNGWGSALGFDALRWNPYGDKIYGYLLSSDNLPTSWEELDMFEGLEYIRILIPVFLESNIEVAFAYASADSVDQF